LLLVERIGWSLRERYRLAEELPLNLLRALWRVDANREASVHKIKGNFEILT
jgi:hypothetical protein